MPRIYKDGRSKVVGRRQYERLWKPRGWSLSVQRNTNQAPSHEPARAPAIAAATVAQVIEWVGDDPDRAEEALQLEESRPDGPRKTLTDVLTPIAIKPPAQEGPEPAEAGESPDTQQEG